LGKTLGVPVHELLGGAVRDRIRMYGWVGGDDPTGIAEAIAAQLDVGLTAVKMNAIARACGHPKKHVARSSSSSEARTS
jgi:L-alanine-DL-glutamate epimerase-like enolase superfamily enzyme